MTVTIRAREPFDFLGTLRFVLCAPGLTAAGRAFSPLLDYFEEDEYRRTAEVGGRPVLFGVREVSERGARLLRVRVLAGPKDTATLEAVGSLGRRLFSTELDLLPFYRLAESDRVLARLVRHFHGVRIPQAATVFDCVISAILEQQVNLSFARQVKKALIEDYGRPVKYQGRAYNTFPSPAALAIATPRELRRLQISGPKARYLIGISRAVLDGSLDLEGLREASPDFADSRLREWKGIGPWTAQYVGLRALGQLDCLPASDVGLQKSIQFFYGLRQQPSVKRVERWGRKWAGWRSYATFYLWLTAWEEPACRERLRAEMVPAPRRGAPSAVPTIPHQLLRATGRHLQGGTKTTHRPIKLERH